MPTTATREPGYKNAPFELSPDLQALLDDTADKLVLPKTKVMALALAKGLPVVRQFLLGDNTSSDERRPLSEVEGDLRSVPSHALAPRPAAIFSLNAAKPTKEAGRK